MKITVSTNPQDNGQAAATFGARRLREVLQERGEANIIVATGASQLQMLTALVKEPGIDWSRITAFHLDEYIGIPITHPASFRKYLWERFHSKLPLPLRALHYINVEKSIPEECERLGKLIAAHPIDVCFAGIGENAHLAFNDPPADFDTTEPYIVVNLDEACRRQQLGEGWFTSMAEIPQQAVSMSVRQIMRSRCIVITAPDIRKAKAVAASINGPISSLVPSSILQQHPEVHFFLDSPAASLLSGDAVLA